MSKFYLDSLLTVFQVISKLILHQERFTHPHYAIILVWGNCLKKCWKLRFNLSRVGFAVEKQVILFTIWTLKPKEKVHLKLKSVVA